MEIKKTVIILSTGRTGTMFFANLFKELVPQADVYHEAGERSRQINILTHAHLGGFLPIEAPLWAWKRAIDPDLINCTKEIYIDSNNHLYAFLPLKPELYPNLHVVHLIRDPREYVRSHINWARHRFKSFVANYLIPFWQPNAWLLNEMSHQEWLHLNRFERYCWVWDFKNRFIAQLESTNYPYFRVHFEDFFNHPNPLEALDRLFSFMGVETTNDLEMEKRFLRPINPGKNKSFPHWAKWNLTQSNQLARICGETMVQYKYGLENEWQMMIGNVPKE